MIQKKQMAKKQTLIKHSAKTLAFILLAANISACSTISGWFKEEKETIKGERISVLGNNSDTSTADSALSSVKVLIPKPLENDKWYKSNGYHYLIPSNPEVARDFVRTLEVSTGKGAKYGQHISISPVIADGKVFTISTDSVISAFDAHNIKKELWHTKLKIGRGKDNFSTDAGMSYYSGNIYATTGYNELVALNANTGEILWTRTIGEVPRSAPAIKNNTLFINTLNNKLYAIDATDGSILWTHNGSTEEISIVGSASPVVYKDTVIAPYSSGEMYALNTNDGTEIWSDVFARHSINSYGLLPDIDATPVVSFGKVFVISNDGVLAASTIDGDKRLWEQQISGRKTPWVAGDFLYVISNDNQLACIHIKSGGIKWIKQLQNYRKEKSKDGPITWSGPVLAGDYLWLVGSHGKLVAMSPRDGTIESEHKIPKNIYSAPSVAYGNIYLFGDDAELVMLEGDNSKDSEASNVASAKNGKGLFSGLKNIFGN